MKPIFTYLKKLIETNSEESSKRFISLYTMVLVTYMVVFFTRKENFVEVLSLLLGFVLVLMGVSVWQSIKNKKNDN